jgi:hypothetical protein
MSRAKAAKWAKETENNFFARFAFFARIETASNSSSDKNDNEISARSYR